MKPFRSKRSRFQRPSFASKRATPQATATVSFSMILLCAIYQLGPTVGAALDGHIQRSAERHVQSVAKQRAEQAEAKVRERIADEADDVGELLTRNLRNGADRVVAPVGQSMAEAKAAVVAVNDADFEAISGYCSRFVRQVVESVHGPRFKYLFGSSAKVSAEAFLNSPYGYEWPRNRELLGGIQQGDILFKRFGSGGYGHVGIYVGDIPGIGKQLVCENSSVTVGRISGAKGYRTLARYGHFDVVGRLPLPKPTPTPAPTATPEPTPTPLPARLILVIPNEPTPFHADVRSARFDFKKQLYLADKGEVISLLTREALSPSGQTVPLREAIAASVFDVAGTDNQRRDARDPRFYVFVEAAK